MAAFSAHSLVSFEAVLRVTAFAPRITRPALLRSRRNAPPPSVTAPMISQNMRLPEPLEDEHVPSCARSSHEDDDDDPAAYAH